MPLSHTAREMLWIEAWSDLLERLAAAPLPLVDAQGERLDVDACKGAIQDQAYRGKRAEFQLIWHKGQRALQVTFADAGAPS